MTEVAYLHIERARLVCTCGEETMLADTTDGGTLFNGPAAYPEQTCPRCGAVWETPATADCTPGKRPEIKLSGPQERMLLFFLSNERSCRKRGIPGPELWGTDGLGGARVSRALERRGLVVTGYKSDGYAGARLTPEGRARAEQLRNERQA